MKALKSLVGILALFLITSLFVTAMALADDASAALAPPPGLEWVPSVLAFVQGLPKVGPIVAAIIKYLGAVAALMTVLAGAFRQTSLILSKSLGWMGMDAASAKVQAFCDKVYPILAWLGMQNVQKKD